MKRTRQIVRIDEAKCDGCGLCVPSCAEGAIRIVDGKARLSAENLCDGLGACLGHCPQGAITIEERPAEEFDERAVHAAKAAAVVAAAPARHAAGHEMGHAGCPGARMRMLGRPAAQAAPGGPPPVAERPSQLGHWPVQLALVPTAGPMWQNADVLVAADCVPFAYPDFHEKLLAGRSVAIACPKLDDMEPYIQKLAAIFAGNAIRSITVAHMEVPCCGGIVYAVHTALKQSGRTDIPVRDVTVGIDGTLRNEP